MNINEYIASKQNAIKRISSEIRERWNNRVVKYSWHLMGVDGANQYLANYGNGISALKAISLAICAESEGYPEVALGFWTRAFEIETGVTPPTPRQAKMRKPVAEVVSDAATAPEWKAKIFVPELPSHLQPESIVTMQAVDAPFEREHYINSNLYWGQPKRDGSRRVIIATPEKVYYQSRSTNLKGQPNHEIDRALLDAACKIGIFVLNGELYYRSVTGSEHRTAPQAITANIAAGTDVPPVAIYAIFKALWYAGCDLTTATEAERIKAGEEIGKHLPSEFFEVLATARCSQGEPPKAIAIRKTRIGSTAISVQSRG
jgi:hypothetical protein